MKRFKNKKITGILMYQKVFKFYVLTRTLFFRVIVLLNNIGHFVIFVTIGNNHIHTFIATRIQIFILK